MKQNTSKDNLWYIINNVHEVPSPALLVYPDRIERNIEKMIEIAGGSEKLRPHVKTHKMAEVVKLQMKHGITKFKCATIAEAEMVAKCGAIDILLAMQPVGPNIERFFSLKKLFPESRISCIADNEEVIKQLSAIATKYGIDTAIWLDINNGMDRTGIVPGEDAARLYKMIVNSAGLKAEGLHVYDGHIHDKELSVRQKRCNDAYIPVYSFIEKLKMDGIPPFKIVAGGTPSFPVHASRKGVECSPGTLLLWDYKSASNFDDMDFLQAAVLLMRIVSKPGNDLLCIDLGHKAVASEMPQPRVDIFGIKNFKVVNHSEEHLVISTPVAGKLKTGDPLYGIPYHICPTVALYESVAVVENNMVTGQWKVEARKRKVTI
jgi:D-serine deaminase-like pyridoxal phosphate-dependent protein